MGVSAAVAGTAISCGESKGRGSWRFFTEREALVVEATCAQLIPTDRDPGAREAGVVHYIDIQLSKRLRKHQAAYRKGIAALDAVSRSKFGKGFVELTADQQVEALNALEENSGASFDVLLAQTRQRLPWRPAPRRQSRHHESTSSDSHSAARLWCSCRRATGHRR